MSEIVQTIEPTREQKLATLKANANDLQVSITKEAEEKLAEMQEKYPESAIPSDLSDKKNFKMVHETIQIIKGPRLALEKNRKEVVEPLNAITKKINSAAKPLKEAYIELEEPWKKAKKAFETAEEIRKREEAQAELDRVNKINSRIAEIKSLPGSNIKSESAEIGVAIAKLELDHENFDYQEFSEQGEAVYTESLELLNEMYNQKVKTEEFERELAAKEAAEKAEREKREKEESERLAAQKKEQEEAAAKLKAQQEEIDRQKREIEEQKLALRRAEEEKKRAAEAAEEEKRRAAIRAENERVMVLKKEAARKEEERKAAEAEEAARLKREYNMIHAKEDLNKILASEEDVQKVINAVIAGKVRHMMWLDNLEPKING